MSEDTSPSKINKAVIGSIRHAISSALSAIDAAHEHLSGKIVDLELAHETHRLGRAKLLDILARLDVLTDGKI
jgi:hypothetical protein